MTGATAVTATQRQFASMEAMMPNEARLVSVLGAAERDQLEKLLSGWLQKLE